MAITNLAFPSGSPTVQDTLWHVFNTNITGQPDYKYVVDLYVGGTQQVRVKLYPEPSNGRGYFDAGPIVRNTMTYEWLAPKEELIVSEPNVSGQVGQTYQYRIGEEYSGTTYLNLASGNVTAYNWTAPLFKRKVNDISTYTNLFFTNRPQNIKASLGDNIFIPAKDINKLLVVAYNQNNQLIGTIINDFVTTRSFIELNIGSTALNKISPIITSATKYYQVPIEETKYYTRVLAAGAIVEGLTCLIDKNAALGNDNNLRIDLDCNLKYDSYNLHFMNHLGMFDTAKFGLVSRLSMDVTRKGYQKRDYTLGSSSVSYYDSSNKYVASKVNYLNKKDYTYKLTMDAPTDAEYEWLAELIDSPQIFMEVEGYYYPVSLKNTNYEYSKYVNNRMRVLEIEVEMNQTRFSQLR
jgi:hypothetical protein